VAKRPAESRSGTLTCYYARRDGSLATWRQTARAAWEALPAPALPVVIIGGILGGIFTATEAGVTAVVYALIVGFFVYRKLRLKELPRIFAKSIGTGHLCARTRLEFLDSIVGSSCPPRGSHPSCGSGPTLPLWNR
jgi:TRAP-type mannitol/chloroaromatic compound transport system permease large subunit